MASLPSVAVNSSLKLDHDLRKTSPSSTSIEKRNSIFYQRGSSAAHSDTSSVDSKFLHFGDALSIIKGGTHVEPAYYFPVLQECINRDSVSEAEVMHTHIIKTGSNGDWYLMNFLLNVYGKCGRMDYACKVFDELPRRNVVSFTALMTGYVRNDEPELAIQVFQELMESGTNPTNHTLGSALSACTSLGFVELGKQIHGYVIKCEKCSTSMGNSLCGFYSRCESCELAVKAFRTIEEKDVISWTTAISACGDNGQPELGQMLFVEMLLENAIPNEFTVTGILSVCCKIRDSKFGEQIHSFSIKNGYQFNLPIMNSTMYLYLRSGLIDEARKLFDGMETHTLITWNALIAGYDQMMASTKDVLVARTNGTEALKIFQKLHRSRMKPDLFTFSSILTVCSGLGAMEQGEQIHAQTIKTGFLSDVVVGTAIVSMYKKCGSIERATKAFVEMSTRTIISWTSMITGYAQYGRSEQALQLFEDMMLTGVRPNKVTFVGVLSACSHAGMVNEALGYFEMMKKTYKIKPVMEHYACIIDMFLRLGRLEEAFSFIKKMNFEPNEFIWSNLIAGCRSHGNMELAFYAADKLLELKPRDTETYASLLSMYLSAGRLKDVSKVRKLMRDENLGILKDWSSINIKDRVYSFKPDDKSHSQSKEMYRLLEDLLEKTKGLGYVPRESLVMADEDDDKTFTSTVHHSEKLAVVFGLLNIPSGSAIRIIKSISMCKDCHSFIKFISVLTEREIIVRDSKRLHQFNNGQCSCGDFVGVL